MIKVGAILDYHFVYRQKNIYTKIFYGNQSTKNTETKMVGSWTSQELTFKNTIFHKRLNMFFVHII